MARMIFDVELSPDDFGKAFSGPQLGREACGLRTAQEDLHKRFPLPFGKFRRPSRGRFASQAVEPLTPHCLLSMAWWLRIVENLPDRPVVEFILLARLADTHLVHQNIKTNIGPFVHVCQHSFPRDPKHCPNYAAFAANSSLAHKSQVRVKSVALSNRLSQPPNVALSDRRLHAMGIVVDGQSSSYTHKPATRNIQRAAAARQPDLRRP